MKPELENKLFDKYPKQFSQIKNIECEDGWFDILDNLCSVIQSRLEVLKIYKSKEESNFHWLEIKSKFGGLRLYSYGADESINLAIDLAERFSYRTCKYSGNQKSI